MTNANVANVTAWQGPRAHGAVQGGEKKVLVPESAVIVSFTPTERSELKPGAKVFAVTQRQPTAPYRRARQRRPARQVPPM